MRLYWIRHGQMDMRASLRADFASINSLFNQESQGALTPRGVREAQAVARHFERNPVDALYSSPLVRAVQTAEATAQALRKPLSVHEGITELRTGKLPEDSGAARFVRRVTQAPLLSTEAKKFILGGALIPLYFQNWRQGRTQGGESPADLQARLTKVFQELGQAHGQSAKIALFAHGYLIFYLSAVLAEPSLLRLTVMPRPYLRNGSITEMELSQSGKLELVSYAKTGHLG